MDRIEQLESENRQLRTAYEILEQQYADLEHELDVAGERIGELEHEADDSEGGDALGSDEERIYVASRRRKKFHRLTCDLADCIVNSPNLIEFGSHREAREAGFKPCGQCKP